LLVGETLLKHVNEPLEEAGPYALLEELLILSRERGEYRARMS